MRTANQAWRPWRPPTRSESPVTIRSSDGNKRAAFLATGLFLGINGISFRPDKVEAYKVYLALAAGEVSEEELAAWIDRNSRKRGK